MKTFWCLTARPRPHPAQKQWELVCVLLVLRGELQRTERVTRDNQNRQQRDLETDLFFRRHYCNLHLTVNMTAATEHFQKFLLLLLLLLLLCSWPLQCFSFCGCKGNKLLTASLKGCYLCRCLVWCGVWFLTRLTTITRLCSGGLVCCVCFSYSLSN